MHGMEFRIRTRASDADVELFDRLNFESFRLTFLRGEKLSDEEARVRFDEFERGDPLDPWGEGHEVFFGEDGAGVPAGLVWVADRGPFWRWGERLAWVYNLHVVPGFRRLGLARTLLGVAEGWARDRGLGSIALHVSVWNDAARSLYESAGYGLVYEHEESRFYEKKL